MDFSQRRENYLIAVYILLPTFLLALLILLIYIYCSKRYRLNWYERTLLEEHEHHTADKCSVSVDTINSNSSLTPLIQGCKELTVSHSCAVKPTVSFNTQSLQESVSYQTDSKDSKGVYYTERRDSKASYNREETELKGNQNTERRGSKGSCNKEKIDLKGSYNTERRDSKGSCNREKTNSKASNNTERRDSKGSSYSAERRDSKGSCNREKTNSKASNNTERRDSKGSSYSAERRDSRGSASNITERRDSKASSIITERRDSKGSSYSTERRDSKGSSYSTERRDSKGSSYSTERRDSKGSSYSTERRDSKGSSYSTERRDSKGSYIDSKGNYNRERRDSKGSYNSAKRDSKGIINTEKRGSKGSLTAEWLPGCKRMGSSPSSPVKDVSQKFWVPPAVIERKRAQSLVPSLSQIDSDEVPGHWSSMPQLNMTTPTRPFSRLQAGLPTFESPLTTDHSSGQITPNSMSGTKDVAFTFPGDSRGSITSNEMPFIPGQRPRRASMQDAIDLKKIDTKLYDRKLLRQQSLSSGEEENLGAVNCSLHYNTETHLLAVNILQAMDLVPKDFSGMANPYCKVSLLPVHRSQLQTRVHHKTLDPKFDEEFIFDVSPQKLKTCVLEILLFDFDQFSRHECMGQVRLLLENIDLTEKVDLWKGISHYEKQKSKDQRDIGDVMFSLSYLSSAERLTVVIIKARNLRHIEEGKMTENKSADPFVKVCVVSKGRRIKKKKTSTVHGSLNPTWNEALSFSVSREVVKEVSLELTVCHENKLGNDDILGHVSVSADSDGDEKVHWNDLVSFRSAVARWHTLL